MAKKRNFNGSRLFMALVITVLIFGLGVALGLIIDSQRVQWSQRESQQQKLDYESLQWQYLYLTSAATKEETCVLLQTSLQKSIIDLGQSLDKIQAYRVDSHINAADFELIERAYLIDNLKYWLMATKTKKECGEDYVVVLYFFSEKNCPSCPDQGVILTHFKKKYDEKLLVFPVNLDLENTETSLKIVKNIFNITTLPSIVVENVTYSRAISADELGKIICNSFSNKSSCASES